MSNNTKLNGAPRKQLRDQLDRLDTIIDALDVALAEAVRDAVSSAVREAVQAVMRELTSNPEVLRALAGAAVQAQPVPTSQPVAQPAQQSSILSKMRCRLGRTWDASVAALTFVAAWSLSMMPPAAGWVRQTCHFVWRNRIVAGASLGVGLAVGVASYFCGPTISSMALAICSAGMSAVAFVVVPFTSLWARLTRYTN